MGNININITDNGKRFGQQTFSRISTLPHTSGVHGWLPVRMQRGVQPMQRKMGLEMPTRKQGSLLWQRKWTPTLYQDRQGRNQDSKDGGVRDNHDLQSHPSSPASASKHGSSGQPSHCGRAHRPMSSSTHDV